MITTDVEPVHTAISSGERRFEEAGRSIGLFLGPAVFLLLLWMPMPTLSAPAHRLAAVVGFTVVWWATEAVPAPVTALIATALAVLLGVAPAQDALAPFANPIIFIFLGAFILARAIAAHNVDGRIARSVLALPFIRHDLIRSRTALGLLTLGISAWMNNTATAAMMTPIARGILGKGTHSHGGFGTGLMLLVGYAASIGGMLTPVGAGPNLITIGLLESMGGVRVNFVQWMILCVPIALMAMAALLAITTWLFPLAEPQGARAAQDVARHTQKWLPGQRNTLVVFGTAVALWILPGVLAFTMPDASITKLAGARLDEGVVAIAAACLLFLMPVHWQSRTFTLGWKEAHEIDWGTLLMFGGGLALGRMMLVTGLAEAIGVTLVRLSGAESLWAITAMAAAVSIIVTEVMSNTAAIAMLVPVVIGIAQASGIHPVPPAMAVCLGGSFGFIMPIGTPPNAIVYGTGLIPLRSMMRAGILLDLIGFGIIVGGLRLLCPLLGFV